MFNRKNNPSSSEESSSDSESSSSDLSDATSRTTATDSYYDVKSDVEQAQAQPDVVKKDGERKRVVPAAHDSSDESTDDESLRKQINDVYGADDVEAAGTRKTTITSASTSTATSLEPQLHTGRTEWSNPYWGADRQTTVTTQARTGENKDAVDTRRDSLDMQRNEAKRTSGRKRDSSGVSITSGESYHTTGKCVSDESDGQNDLLTTKELPSRGDAATPTSTRRASDDNLLTEGDSRKALKNERKAYTESWVNPYWSTSNDEKSTEASAGASSVDAKMPPSSAKSPTVSELNDESSKDTGEMIDESAERSAATVEIKQWANPYWKDHKPAPKTDAEKAETSSPSTTSEGTNEAARAVASTDSKSDAAPDEKKEGKQWENPYWKNASPHVSELKHQDEEPRSDSLSTRAAVQKDESDKSKATERSTSETTEEKSWENPYWKDRKLSTSTPDQKDEKQVNEVRSTDRKSQSSASSKDDEKPWQNPYWKEHHSLVSAPEAREKQTTEDKPWENPYWKQHPRRSSAPTIDEHEKALLVDQQAATHTKSNDSKPWSNPYWKDHTPTVVTSTKVDEPDVKISRTQEKELSEPASITTETSSKVEITTTVEAPKSTDKPWENPYWKEHSRRSSAPAIDEHEKALLADQEAASTAKSNDGKPWANPYWKDHAPAAVTSTKVDESETKLSSADKKESWKNPYWKELSAPASISTETSSKTDITPAVEASKSTEKPWENPYWKQHPRRSSAPAIDEHEKALLADQEAASHTKSSESQPWMNPYWKDHVAEVGKDGKTADDPAEKEVSKTGETSAPKSEPREGESPKESAAGVSTNQDQQEKVSTDKPWENPYWKQQISLITALQDREKKAADDKPWENPYWKQHPRRSSAPAIDEHEKAVLADQEAASTTKSTESKPWTNPYWKDHLTETATKIEDHLQLSKASTDAESGTNASSIDKKESWENPYWKERAVATASSERQERSSSQSSSKSEEPKHVATLKTTDKSWENPYWKQRHSLVSAPAARDKGAADDKPWENPYWKQRSRRSSAPAIDEHEKAVLAEQEAASTAKSNEGKSWTNPYWKDHGPETTASAKLEQSLRLHKVPEDAELDLSTKQKESVPSETRSKTEESVTVEAVKTKEKPWENPYWNQQISLITALQDKHKGATEDKPWENPYWKQHARRSSAPAIDEHEKAVLADQEGSSTAKSAEDKSWTNPYWKEAAASETTSKTEEQTKVEASKTSEKPWENPYWKQQISLITALQDKSKGTTGDKPWENPYWREHARRSSAPAIDEHEKALLADLEVASITKANEGKPWTNPYWKDHAPATATAATVADNQRLSKTTKEAEPSLKASSTQEKQSPVASALSTEQDKKVTSDPSSKIEVSQKPWENLDRKEQNPLLSAPQDQPKKASDDKSWTNPYWKEASAAPTVSPKQKEPVPSEPSPKTEESAKVEAAKTTEKPWENPYWNQQISLITALQDKSKGSTDGKPWENPYWKDGKHDDRPLETSLAKPTKSEETSRPSLYWTGQVIEIPTTIDKHPSSSGRPTPTNLTAQSAPSAKKDDPAWENPYWKQQAITIQASTTTSEKPKENLIPTYENVGVISLAKTPDEAWRNPYWRENSSQPSSTAKQQEKPPSQTPASPQDQKKSWQNPYWKDDKYKVIFADKQPEQPQTSPVTNERTQATSTPSQPQTAPWANPYWKDNANAPAPSSSRAPEKPWQNPAASAPAGQPTGTAARATAVEPKKADAPWKNPYWGDNQPAQASQPRENPSVGVSTAPKNPNEPSATKLQTLSSPSQQAGQYDPPPTRDPMPYKAERGLILDEVWTLDNTSPSEHAVPPIPSFYKRIYPRESPLFSTQAKPETFEPIKASTIGQLSQVGFSPVKDVRPDNVSDDASPFTIDSQGVAHYQPAASSAPPVSNSNSEPASSSILGKLVSVPKTTNPVPPLPSSTFAPISEPPIQEVYRPPTPPRDDVAVLHSIHLRPSSSSSPILETPIAISAALVTPSELRDIQKALRFLNISEDSMITIEKAEYASRGRIAVAEIPYASLSSFGINGKGQRSRGYPPPSSSSRSQDDSFLAAYEHDSRYPPDTFRKARTVSGPFSAAEPFPHL